MFQRLFFGTKIIAQNLICKIRLIQLCLLRCPSNLLSILVLNNDWLVIFGKSPKTNVTVQAASLTCRTLSVVALLTKRLPIMIIVSTAARTWNSVVWRKFDCRLRLSAVSALVSAIQLELLPKFLSGLRSRLSFCRELRGHQLVLCTLLNDAGKSVPARIDWTQDSDSCGLSDGISLTGFEG